MVIGVRSVFSGVVGGAAGTVSRITGALGKGIASLTFDSEFQRKRREAIKKRGKQNFGESLARSSKGLAMGIFEGVTGVATKPIEGARQEGVGGFFKGVGKGVVGLVARPTGTSTDKRTPIRTLIIRIRIGVRMSVLLHKRYIYIKSQLKVSNQLATDAIEYSKPTWLHDQACQVMQMNHSLKEAWESIFTLSDY